MLLALGGRFEANEAEFYFQRAKRIGMNVEWQMEKQTDQENPFNHNVFQSEAGKKVILPDKTFHKTVACDGFWCFFSFSSNRFYWK